MSLTIAYIGLSLLMIILIIGLGFYAITKTFKKNGFRLKALLVTGLAAWQIYVWGMASSGFFRNFEFPPRFFLFMILPLFIFTAFFAYSHRNSQWLQNIPASWLIYFQSFRIVVETIFVVTVAQGFLPTIVTIEGYNYDMIFGISAPILAYLAFHKKPYRLQLLLWWNYLGLTVLASVIFLFISSIYLPEIYGSTTPIIPIEFGSYPYVLVPGFLMPLAVFVHALSISQLSYQINRNKSIIAGQALASN